MTNLFYALLFILSGGFNSTTDYSNSKEPQFEQTQKKDYTTSTDWGDDDDDEDDDEKENPDEN